MVRVAAALSTVAVLIAPGASQDPSREFKKYYPGSINNVPAGKCGVDCGALCVSSLSDGLKKPPSSCGLSCGWPAWMISTENFCQEACVAHAVETTRPASGWFGPVQQGMYIQKVMAEYCDRGICTGGASQGSSGGGGWGGWRWSGIEKKADVKEAEVQEHKHQAQEAESWGFPQKASGWPSDACAYPAADQQYYCQAYCQNIYHDKSSDLGYHPGCDENWKANQATCVSNCNANWETVKEQFDSHCSCTKKNGKVDLPPGFLQEEHHDVGAFMQMPNEL